MKINLEEAEPREPDWEGLEAAVRQAAIDGAFEWCGQPDCEFCVKHGLVEDDILDAEFIE